MSIEMKKSRMGVGSPIISKLENDSKKNHNSGFTPVSKSGKGIKMKKSSIKQASGKSKYNSIIGSRSRMSSGSSSKEQHSSTRRIAKDRIIEYVAKFIRTKHYQNEVEAEKDNGYDDMINNLKEFLQYLEDKQIINPKQLEDEKEVNNLISDILKLDLTKFKGSGSEGTKKRAGSQNHKGEKELKGAATHKRHGSERAQGKSKRLKDVRHSDTPSADNFAGRRVKPSSEGGSKRTGTIEHAQSQHSSRRKNPSLEERKSTSSSINSGAMPSSQHRRAIPSLEKAPSAKGVRK